jgi:hypothetical protein
VDANLAVVVLLPPSALLLQLPPPSHVANDATMSSTTNVAEAAPEQARVTAQARGEGGDHARPG